MQQSIRDQFSNTKKQIFTEYLITEEEFLTNVKKINDEFISVQQELRSAIPYAKVIKEDIDNSYAHLQFDVGSSDEVMLERLLVRRGFVKV
mgnify:CR=1 FL=1